MSESINFKRLAQRLHTLSLFRSLLCSRVLSRLSALLDGLQAATRPLAIDLYCEFVFALYEQGGNLGDVLLQLVLESENPAVLHRAKGRELPLAMAQSLADDLATFSALSALSPADLKKEIPTDVPLPLFDNTAYDFESVYAQRLAEISTKGYGIFAAWPMFTLGEGSTLLPVKNPDPQRLSDLTGYAREREQILVNTRALLAGLPANNILLYGDAGTGKSSSVKAIGNEFAARGLRLVEVRKNQLYQIPLLMDALAENPLKFILFIDDLSFPSDDADFTALKAILEGNISARPRNIVVYATSNRRHMVKQSHSGRQGDELHLNDTLEEESSLAARFGLTITFQKPDRELYSDIVRNLAAEYGVKTETAVLLAKAEAHAIRYGGRSPRTARQFVEYCKAEQDVRE